MSRILRDVIVMAMILPLCALGCGNSNRTAGNDNADENTVVMGVSLLNLSNEFIVLLDEAMKEKADELGVRLIVNDARRSAERQVQQVENFLLQDVDAIILNPCELDASSPAVDKALSAGVPIVNVNSQTRSEPTAFVGSRDEESAQIAMEYIANRLNGKGNVLMMQGFMGQTAQIDRERGAQEVLAKYPKLKLLAVQTAEWDRAKAVTLMENWIQSFGEEIHAVFAQNDEMAMGAVLALEQAGIKDRVVVAGVDAIADALEAVKAGRLDATVFQDARAQGSTAVETALKIINGEPYEKKVFIPFQLVTKNNVDTFMR
ncbi:MAG: sugar ABC transporter substrate-binding protein [Candidatus Hydrogenedentota bacterium]